MVDTSASRFDQTLSAPSILWQALHRDWKIGATCSWKFTLGLVAAFSWASAVGAAKATSRPIAARLRGMVADLGGLAG